MSNQTNNKPLIHFAHANGFPSQTYQYLFDLLSSQYDVAYIDKIGHNPDFPITQNWTHLIDEVKASVEQVKKERGLDEPVVGLGHSLGSVLTLLCAYKYPNLFKGIILLEPPLQAGVDALGWRFLSNIGLGDKVSPAGISKNRRVLYDSKAEVHATFSSKPFFKRFHPKCLESYIEHGFTTVDEGVRLSFEREKEVAIFRTLPYNAGRIATQLNIPVLVIKGRYSELVSTGVLPRAIRLLKLPSSYFEGGHMFPLEQPEATAELIHNTITSWQE